LGDTPKTSAGLRLSGHLCAMKRSPLPPHVNACRSVAPRETMYSEPGMRVIGLTGSICSGKSTIAQFLAQMGAAVINADEIGHEAYGPRCETWQQVVDAFGKQILTTGDEVDRKKLGEIVFKDPEALKRLNGIMHPGMHRVAEKRIERLKREGAKVIVLEAPLLVEANWLDLVDEVWVAKASEANAMKRCAERSGLSEAQARSRMASQISPDEKAKYGDVVIDTNVSLAEVEAKVKELWEERFGKRRRA
jgi:dephospho-CoA kinase